MEFFVMFILIFIAIPAWVAYSIGKGRNRTTWKCVLVALCFGWLGDLFLGLGLKVRDQATGFLR